MKKYLLIIMISYLVNGLLAQNFDFENYTWDEELKPYPPTETEATLSEIGLKNQRVLELVIEEEGPVMYSLSHTKRFLNSQEALERNNKIYLPVSYDGKVEKQVARVVNSAGKIIELDQDDILQATDETTGNRYSYFALEGLEIGNTMEYITITKFIPSLTGATYTFQSEYVAKDVSFEVFFPDHLVFEFKSYNGFPEMEEDTTTEDYNRFFAHTDRIEALENEAYQNYNANEQKVAYKLTGNHYSKNYNINSFSSFASDIYELTHPTLDKKEQKIIDKYLAAAKVDYARTKEDKIRMIEDYVKTHVVYIEKGDNLPRSIVDIEAQGVAGEIGLFVLYAQLLKAIDVEVEFVGTSNRYVELFDKDFESKNHLSEFAFYFPKFKSYLAPSETLYRYPLIPYQWTDNYGYFVKELSLGGVNMGSGKAKYIESADMSQSIDSLYIFIDFAEGMDAVTYDYFSASTGLDAVYSQAVFSYITSDEDKEDFREELVKVLDESMEIEKLTTKNEGAEFLNKQPYEINATFKSEAFIEKAGKNYLLKVGELIGDQVEMYENKERKSDIEFSFAKMYKRTISFKIPEGYTLKNIEKCKENLNYKDENGEVIMGFVTNYTIADDVVTIQNTEFYNKVRMTIDPYYEPFRNVVNAAADFNKIVLVLESK